MLLKNDPHSGDDPRLVVRAHWPGRAGPTDQHIGSLREDPTAIQAGKSDTAPHSFEVLLIDDLGGDFSRAVKFIDRLEANITLFYDLVGQNLRAWQAPPRKAVKPRDANTDGVNGEDVDSSVAPRPSDVSP